MRLGRQVEQSPGFALRIVLFEVGEEGGIREMLETRGVVRHAVAVSWEVSREVAVAVGSLV